MDIITRTLATGEVMVFCKSSRGLVLLPDDVGAAWKAQGKPTFESAVAAAKGTAAKVFDRDELASLSEAFQAVVMLK
jgi:hypothetical protein